MTRRWKPALFGWPSWMLGAYLLFAAFAFAEAMQEPAIGIVHNAKGDATISREGESIPIPATPGIEVLSQDLLRTGENGSLGIVFADDSVLSLGPNSELVLEEFIFSPAKGKLSWVMRMVRGTAVFLSGIIAKLSPRSARVETPVATVGIRGTRFATGTTEAGKEVFLLLPCGDERAGEIVISNEGGSEVLSKPGYATSVSDRKTPPTPAAPMENNEIEKIFGEALRAQPEPPLRFSLRFQARTINLTPESEEDLQAILAIMNARPWSKIRIVGHTDRVGSREDNFHLGLLRAMKVKQMLVRSGVDPQLVESSSRGEDDPLVGTKDGAPEPRNRRVEVILR